VPPDTILIPSGLIDLEHLFDAAGRHLCNLLQVVPSGTSQREIEVLKKSMIAVTMILATIGGASADQGWTTGGVNFRDGPGTSYYKVGTIARCVQVDVIESRNGWHRVQWSGHDGWVAARYVSYDSGYCGSYQAPSHKGSTSSY